MSQKAVTLHPIGMCQPPAESISSLESSEELLMLLYRVPFKTVSLGYSLGSVSSTLSSVCIDLQACFTSSKHPYLQFPTIKYSQVSPIASLKSIRHKLSRFHKKLKTKPVKPHLCLQLQELWSRLRIPLTGFGTASSQAVQISWNELSVHCRRISSGQIKISIAQECVK